MDDGNSYKEFTIILNIDTKRSLVTRWYCIEKPLEENPPIETLARRFQNYVPGIVMKVHNLGQSTNPLIKDYRLLKVEIPSVDGKIQDERRILVSEKYRPLDKRLEFCEANFRYPLELDTQIVDSTEAILISEGWKKVEKNQ